MDKLLLIENIKRYSAELGFADFGIIPITKYSMERQRLEIMILEERVGEMQYLKENILVREDPSLLLEGARSIMVFIIPYLSNSLQDKSVPLIAKYAYGLDYHYIVKSRLNRLCNFISQDISDFSFRVFTDSAPIFERSMAVKAGLGFIGKNSMFISKSCGIHNFIGVVISNIEPLSAFKEIEDVTSTSICGTCKRCIEACPTGAIIAPFTIDANMCISYKTIEYRGDDKIGYTNNRLFGCDICIDICPWSRKSSRFVWEEFMPIKLESGEYITSLSYENWMKMSVGYFKKSFKSSPIYRAGLKKIKKVLFEQSKYEKRKKGE